MVSSLEICNWKQFLDALDTIVGLKESPHRWIFRGQSSDWPLKTSFERALEDYEIDLREAPIIEGKLIRDFRRRYSGPNHELVLNDILYCLSLMQHHRAPTRLLDWTYSPYVAAFFALEKKVKRVPTESFPVITQSKI